MKTVAFNRALALVLALILLSLLLAACGGKQGKALLTLDLEDVNVSFSVNHYQLLLSRFRGDLVKSGASNIAGTADKSAFWDVLEYGNDGTPKTVDEICRERILEQCKIYLVALWFYEKNDLKLSETATENIKQQMEELLTHHGNGSKTALNSVLAQYGVNYDLLKSFYETEAKLGTVQTFLYGANASKVGTSIKDVYLNEHYVHFKRILITEEVAGKSVQKQANDLYETLKTASDEAFDAAIAEYNAEEEYTNGYYIPIGTTTGNTADQTAVFSQVNEMEIGETALLELSGGVMILRRYEPTPGAYSIDANSVWFSAFAGNLMSELFAKECESYLSKITVDEAVLAEAPVIKGTEPDYYF